MKHLYLIRHAKSSWSNHLISDFDRPLNHRGKHDAPLMGERLAARDIQPDLIISSPAKRARKTAAKIASKMDYPKSDIQLEKSIYDAHPEAIIDIISCLDDRLHDVIVVGHNPGFSVVANILGSEPVGNMPTCSVVGIELDSECWSKIRECTGKTLFFDYPNKDRS